MTNSINVAAEQRMNDADLTNFNEAMAAIQRQVGLGADKSVCRYLPWMQCVHIIRM